VSDDDGQVQVGLGTNDPDLVERIVLHNNDAYLRVAFRVDPQQDPCDTCGDGHRVSVWLTNEDTENASAA